MEIKELIGREDIKRRIRELAGKISRDYSSLVSVTVLDGARRFSALLRAELQELGVKVEDYEITLSSYGSGTGSSGRITVVRDISHDITGKDIVIMEDIIDSGFTIDFLVKHLLSKGVKSVKVCSLTSKRERREVDIEGDYVGFQIPNKFVLGFGMDINGEYRDLPYIGYVEE